MFLSAFIVGVLTTASDPPCEPGFNSNFYDETVWFAIIFWAGIAVFFALCIIKAMVADLTKKKYWSHKYGSKDGVTHERTDLTSRGYVSSRGGPVIVYRKGQEVHVRHNCPICDRTNFYLQYHETLGRSPEETCADRATHPKQISEPIL